MSKARWTERRINATLREVATEDASKIKDRVKRIIRSGSDDKFLILLQRMISAEPQQVDASVKGNIKINWPGAAADNG